MDRLKQNITTSTVDGDPEETKRRSGLTRCVRQSMTAPTSPDSRCSTLEKIEELSEKMLSKSTIARFVDKGEDSKAVAKLIERLREAIVCYQVGECCAPGSSSANRGSDITAAGDLPPNYPPRSRCSRLPLESALTDSFLKSSFDTFLKLQEVIRCSTTITALAHD